MIPIEKLQQVTTIYTHAHCPDGLASAMILKDAFRMLGMNPPIEFLAHNTPEHRQAAPHGGGMALFCDFAPRYYNDPVEPQTTIVLDHHVGAKAIIESFGDLGVYADIDKEPGVSGAVLAWREVWDVVLDSVTDKHQQLWVEAQYKAVMEFALSVGARDTWQTKDPRFQRGQYVSKMLMSKPASWWLVEQSHKALNHDGRQVDVPDGVHEPYLTASEVEMGRALFEAHEEAVRQAVEQCVKFEVAGPPTGGLSWQPCRLFVFQEQACGFRLTSDVAEALRERFSGPTVLAGFSYVVDKPGRQPKLSYSLRAVGAFDVQKFATANGGGGHKAAAGFSCTMDAVNEYGSPYDFMHRRLAEFLGTPTGRECPK